MSESGPGARSQDDLPTETEIYILPSGEVVIADLPAELAAILDPTLLSPPPVAPQARMQMDDADSEVTA